MRCCKKLELSAFLFHCLFAFFLLSSNAHAHADNSNLHIKSAELVPAEGFYVLHAEFEINFSNEIEGALNKGVPLSFLIEFQLISPRSYWFDDEIITASTRISVSYHALSRQYLLKRGEHQLTFATIADMKDELAHLRDWQVLDKAMLKKGESYNAALRIRLDQSSLPKPLQVEALSSDAWTMVSERYRWTPVFAL